MVDRSGMAAPQRGQVAGASDMAGAASRRRFSCITVGGLAGSSGWPGRGRFAPQVKQMRSSCWTVAAQTGQVRVAMTASGRQRIGGRYLSRD